ncbi:hypothetical protein [Bradyrhizobium sp. BRP22]|uniref:hypothetical protein n=1 Tax=Bradyrhizobium sp. BRP22 TaxID=2793821 RepID=UPI001CD27A52|nr:hypothetical protein [Bradyrhizobium sp. BRP22]
MADIWVKVLEPAENYDLLTLAELKTILGISATDTSEDAQLEMWAGMLVSGHRQVSYAFLALVCPRVRPECLSGPRQLRQRLGRAWVETDEEHTERDTLLRYLMEGQCRNPIRIVSFNTSEGWSGDASEEIAAELRQRCAERGRCRRRWRIFLARHGHRIDIQLSLL